MRLGRELNLFGMCAGQFPGTMEIAGLLMKSQGEYRQARASGPRMARPKNIEYGQSYRFQLAHRGQSRPIEHNRNFTRRDRSSEENALSLLTTACDERRKVLGGLDSFGRYNNSKVMR